MNPEFFDRLPAGEIIPVIPAFIDLAREQKLGAIVLDEGIWLDLGDRDSYLQAHQSFALGPAIHPLARVEDGALVENSVVGPCATIASGAIVRNSVLWPDSLITGNAVLDACIVCSRQPVIGQYRHEDL